MKVGIIGGGITGLVAAYELVKKGADVTILEKEEGLGGLAVSFNLNNVPLEKAYHHFFTKDKYLLNLVKELNLDNKIIWGRSSIGVYYEKEIFPFVSPLDLIKFKPLNLLDKLRLGAVILFLKKYDSWKKLTDIPAHNWLKKYCGEKAYQIIWEPLLIGKFHKHYKQISMAWMWGRIHTRTNSQEKGKSQEKLGYFKGSFQVVIEALVESLRKNNTTIVCSTRVTNISYDPAVSRVLVECGDKIMEFDKVLCTAPSPVFSRIIDGNTEVQRKYIEKLRKIDYVDAICLIFTSTKSLTKYYWNNISETNAPFVVFVEHTNLVDKNFYNGKNVYYIGSYLTQEDSTMNQTDSEIKDQYFNYLSRIFPSFKIQDVEDYFVFKFRNTQHIVDTSYMEKIPEHQTPIPNVYLFNFSQIFPEGRGVNNAVREGIKAAEQIYNGT